MMQKKIIFFLFPFLLFSSIFLINKSMIEYFKYNFFNKDKFYKYILFALYSTVLGFISYKTLINNTFFLPRDLDFIFLTSNYFILNLFIFYFIKNFQNENYTNLLTYNLIIGFTYVSYKFVLIYFFSAPIAVWSISFTNFMGQLNMFANSQEIQGAHNFNNLTLYIKKLFINLIFVFNKYFFSYTFHSVLIWSLIFLFFFNLKKTYKKEKVSLIICILGFIIIQSILLFRYEQDTYYLNSEILLILALALNLRFINNLKLLIIIFSIIFIFLFNPINSNLTLITKNNIYSYCPNVDVGFYEYYTKKISKDIIKKLCVSYNTSK